MCGVCGSDDSGNGVSIQARSYLQLIQRQHKVLQEAESVRDLTCSDRSLVSDKLVNQPLHEEKGKEANHPQSSESQYPEVLTFSIVQALEDHPRNKLAPDSGTLTCDTKSFRWTFEDRIMIRKMNTGSRTGTNHRKMTREIRNRPRRQFL